MITSLLLHQDEGLIIKVEGVTISIKLNVSFHTKLGGRDILGGNPGGESWVEIDRNVSDDEHRE